MPPRTLRYRCNRLSKLGLLGRTRPYRERGSAPHHIWPTRRGEAMACAEIAGESAAIYGDPPILRPFQPPVAEMERDSRCGGALRETGKRLCNADSKRGPRRHTRRTRQRGSPLTPFRWHGRALHGQRQQSPRIPADPTRFVAAIELRSPTDQDIAAPAAR